MFSLDGCLVGWLVGWTGDVCISDQSDLSYYEQPIQLSLVIELINNYSPKAK